MSPLSELGLPQKLASKYRDGYRTKMQLVIDHTSRPETNLYKCRKRQTGGYPTIPPRHGIHPGRAVGGQCKITRSCD